MNILFSYYLLRLPRVYLGGSDQKTYSKMALYSSKILIQMILNRVVSETDIFYQH